MRTEGKSYTSRKWQKQIFNRVGFVVLAMLLQILALAAMIRYFNEHFVFFYGLNTLLGLLIVLKIVTEDGNSTYKLAWILPILTLPIFGFVLYLAFGKSALPQRERDRMERMDRIYKTALSNRKSCLPLLEKKEPDAALQAAYLERMAAAPLFTNTETAFLKSGELYLEALLRELKKAKRFIFLEYFIVEEGEMWDSILQILREKSKAGVDVRLLYDDFGSLFKLPDDYPETLEKMGIQCSVFHPLSPILSGAFNNRDHRKICVIDGNVAFTGGVNLADEYINAVERCGHWLDCGVMLKGEAVWSFTAMFLSMWNFVRKSEEDLEPYRPDPAFCKMQRGGGFCQPFADSPVDNETVGQNAYIHMLSRAKHYVYICTPYLIIDAEMLNALSNAAKCGLDIRIITPAVGDKGYVHALTRSYYTQLIRSGVKIYEYSPGFIHAKTFVADDRYGICGTINLDYRSLYLHHECAVWMYDTAAVPEMRDSYLEILKHCQRIDAEWCSSIPWYKKFMQALLRLFAPLM